MNTVLGRLCWKQVAVWHRVGAYAGPKLRTWSWGLLSSASPCRAALGGLEKQEEVETAAPKAGSCADRWVGPGGWDQAWRLEAGWSRG